MIPQSRYLKAQYNLIQRRLEWFIRLLEQGRQGGSSSLLIAGAMVCQQRPSPDWRQMFSEPRETLFVSATHAHAQELANHVFGSRGIGIEGDFTGHRGPIAIDHHGLHELFVSADRLVRFQQIHIGYLEKTIQELKLEQSYGNQTEPADISRSEADGRESTAS